jgi:hypothetical protein
MKVPINYVIGLGVMVVTGVFLTLAHQTPASRSHSSQTDISVDQSPALNAQDVVENPSMSISVDGQQVPVKVGTTRVKTPRGTATVNVSGNSASVESTHAAPVGNNSNSLNVSVQSNSSSGVSSSSSYSATSSSSNGSSHSYSNVSVFGSGSGSVNLQSH